MLKINTCSINAGSHLVTTSFLPTRRDSTAKKEFRKGVHRRTGLQIKKFLDQSAGSVRDNEEGAS